MLSTVKSVQYVESGVLPVATAITCPFVPVVRLSRYWPFTVTFSAATEPTVAVPVAVSARVARLSAFSVPKTVKNGAITCVCPNSRVGRRQKINNNLRIYSPHRLSKIVNVVFPLWVLSERMKKRNLSAPSRGIKIELVTPVLEMLSTLVVT